MATVAHIWIPVSNLKQSLIFYQRLGFRMQTVINKTEDKRLVGSVAYLSQKDSSFLLILIEKPEVLPPQGEVIIGLTVKNLSKAIQALKKSKVAFMGDVVQIPDRSFIHLKDPDKHVLQITALTNEPV